MKNHMNNKGFALADLLFFISLFLMILVVCVIVIDSNISKFKVSYEDPKQKVSEDTVIEDTVTIIKTEDDTYKALLEKMANIAKIYVTTNYTGSTDQIIIKTSKLVSDNYMDKLYDLKDSKNECRGYIIYDGESSYTPYLNCGKNYKSDNYTESFE